MKHLQIKPEKVKEYLGEKAYLYTDSKFYVLHEIVEEYADAYRLKISIQAYIYPINVKVKKADLIELKEDDKGRLAIIEEMLETASGKQVVYLNTETGKYEVHWFMTDQEHYKKTPKNLENIMVRNSFNTQTGTSIPGLESYLW